MRWLMVVLLASLVALLTAAAAVARHIWLQHVKLKEKPPAHLDTVHEPDQDS